LTGNLFPVAGPASVRGCHRDLAALAILVFAGLNLNHVSNQVTGIPDLLWPGIILCVVSLCFRYAKISLLGDVYAIFFVFLASFLISAELAGLSRGNEEWLLLGTYICTFMLISGLYFWLASQDLHDFEASLYRWRLVLLTSCAAVVLSFWLGPNFGYAGGPALGYVGQRAAGLFSDPNQAGMIALYCLVLVVAHPPLNSALAAAQAGLAIAALMLTMSKSGFVILLVLACVASIARRSIMGLALTACLVAAATLGSAYVLDNYPHLPLEYRERLGGVSNIMVGEISADTTTGRTLLWRFAWDRMQSDLPWGGGLGEYHQMEGGYRGRENNWLGVHNFFLLVLGEGGLFPFFLLIVLVTRLFATMYRARERTVAIGFNIILVGDMLSTHGILSSPYSGVALAIAMAIAERPSPRAASSFSA
jgi:hypothetical protein